MSTPFTKKRDTTDRKKFIRRWIEECGVTYDVASQIYRTMVRTFEDGVANGEKITVGRLGALVPKWQESRTVTMGCRRVRGGVVHERREFNLDPRIRYKFKIYREWMTSRHLNWYG